MSESTPRLYSIVIQPNPRSPVHYRGKTRVVSTEPEERQINMEGVGPLTKHRWSWSPRFWWQILLAWIRPVIIEEEGSKGWRIP